MWFVHLSSIDAGVPLPGLTTGHVLSLPDGPHWFTRHSCFYWKLLHSTNITGGQFRLCSPFTFCTITWITVLKTLQTTAEVLTEALSKCNYFISDLLIFFKCSSPSAGEKSAPYKSWAQGQIMVSIKSPDWLFFSCVFSLSQNKCTT